MRIWIIFLSILALGGSVQGAEPAGARIISMGGAGAALPDDPCTIYWNPAGLHFLDQLSADFTFQFAAFEWPESWGMSYANYSSSRQRGAGLGIYRQKVESPDSLNFGDAVAVHLATVYSLPLGIPLGLSAKYINENWEDAGRKSYFTMDAGTGYRMGGLYVGVSFQSVTQPHSHIFPYRVLAGASFELMDLVTVAVQAAADRWSDIEELDPPDRGAGVEISPGDAFSLQAGRRESPEQSFWTAGLGLGSKQGSKRLYVGYQWPADHDGDKSLFVSYVYAP